MNIGLRLLWLLLAPAVLLVACATYQIDNPTVISSNAPDAIRIYVEPYKVHDGTSLYFKGEWDRDQFIKKALVVKMEVRFVDDPAKAQMTIRTEAFSLSRNLRVYSTTRFNNMAVKTMIEKSSELWFTDNGKEVWSLRYNRYATADADLIAIVAGKILSGETLHKAEAEIIGKRGAYEGLGNIKIE